MSRPDDPVAPIGTRTASEPLAQDAQMAFLAGVAAVDPTKLVKAAIRQGLLDDWFGDRHRPRPIRVIALGKAAPRMVWGLVEASVPFSGFGASPRGVPQPGLEGFQWHLGGHPLPDAASFRAGAALLAHVAALPAGAPVLVLLSGGASACVEAPAVPETELLAHWRAWMREGLPIAALNRRRAGLSRLKGGGLAAALAARGANARVWALPDVPDDQADALAGGMMRGHASRVLADNAALVAAAARALVPLGYTVHRLGRRIAGDAEAEAAAFVDAVAGIPGDKVALVGGGEAEVALPEDAPPGGRCHHAALAAAQHLPEGTVFLAAASDGRDGARATGAWADAATWTQAAADALARRDALAYLEARGRSFDVGVTGTNVNDLFVALRG